MPPAQLRFLALAFASADLLLELDESGRIGFAAGALPDPRDGDAGGLQGRSLMNLLAPASRVAVREALGELKPGMRGRPVEVVAQGRDGRTRQATLRVFILPELAPAISCALTYAGELSDAAAPAPMLDGADAFASRTREAMAAARGAGTPLSLSFVEVSGLDRAASALGPAGSTLLSEIEALLTAASWEGASAARVEANRYAILQDSDAAPSDLAGDVERLGEASGVALQAAVETAALAPAADPQASLRALRLTLDSFLQSGLRGDGGTALSFSGAVMRTLEEAETFRTRVRAGRFDLHYQPVVSLADGGVRHHEALARFAGDASPAAIIRMAEEMNLIGEFDLAVARRALALLAQPGNGGLRLAVNASGQSLASDAFVDSLIERTATMPALRARLIVEVTESAALHDLAAADARIQALRRAGFKVAIDDFGAGAASFDYLRRLSVDSVKIDGTYIRDIATDEKAQKMVAHLVALCRSLKLITVAEMVETPEAAAMLKGLGVDLGQGWLYGRPAAVPTMEVAGAAAARRQGAVETWG